MSFRTKTEGKKTHQLKKYISYCLYWWFSRVNYVRTQQIKRILMLPWQMSLTWLQDLPGYHREAVQTKNVSFLQPTGGDWVMSSVCIDSWLEPSPRWSKTETKLAKTLGKKTYAHTAMLCMSSSCDHNSGITATRLKALPCSWLPMGRIITWRRKTVFGRWVTYVVGEASVLGD